MRPKLVGALALVLVACSSCSLATQDQTKPVGYLRHVGRVSIRYKPEQLYEILGFPLKNMRPEGVVDILAATDDKEKPKTIAHTYSISDLLAMNEVHESDFTPGRFQEKLALCESLRPATSAYAARLSENGHRSKGDIASRGNELRKPDEFVFYKNLYDYCMKAFDNYHYLCRLHLQFDHQLDQKLMDFEHEVRDYLDGDGHTQPSIEAGDFRQARVAMEDFLRGKQPEARAQIEELCSELIRRVQFVADRELFGAKRAPVRYLFVHTYCRGVLKLD